MKAKRTFKDSLFRYMFNNKKRLADLYEALTGRAVSPREIKITTLRGVFMSDIKNDISFRIGNWVAIGKNYFGRPLRGIWLVPEGEA